MAPVGLVLGFHSLSRAQQSRFRQGGSEIYSLRKKIEALGSKL